MYRNISIHILLWEQMRHTIMMSGIVFSFFVCFSFLLDVSKIQFIKILNFFTTSLGSLEWSIIIVKSLKQNFWYFPENVQFLFTYQLHFTTSRYDCVTPASFLELNSLFKTLLTKKRNEVNDIKQRFTVGLDKIKDAASQVT